MIENIEHTTIGILFGRTLNFIVPIYQRGYAWEEEPLDDFLNIIQITIRMG